jgi:hypothetical protein
MTLPGYPDPDVLADGGTGPQMEHGGSLGKCYPSMYCVTWPTQSTGIAGAPEPETSTWSTISTMALDSGVGDCLLGVYSYKLPAPTLGLGEGRLPCGHCT